MELNSKESTNTSFLLFPSHETFFGFKLVIIIPRCLSPIPPKRSVFTFAFLEHAFQNYLNFREKKWFDLGSKQSWRRVLFDFVFFVLRESEYRLHHFSLGSKTKNKKYLSCFFTMWARYCKYVWVCEKMSPDEISRILVFKFETQPKTMNSSDNQPSESPLKSFRKSLGSIY